MNIADMVVIAVIVVCVILAIRGKKKSCCHDCMHCQRKCGGKENGKELRKSFEDQRNRTDESI